ncbi:MAG: hypothetical protein A3B30_00130 [Candidatus Komeilibacteria bacterium RIFCSPLOWO2_01_FULL_52_15]|uniref:NIF system FeS cluster assembly NifU C-terminal domain-containing protein n=2 Tax=Candidatus Komeiliibacteriota TaxID=1817908 RepID=A0A1G2BPA6_9BACT|nr:MAG: hypothetical protein A2677_01990 [Candidatus Komeilibacteria bacterium RIFCSPHIGHO2_01_FULL_52_14]OGY90962.1 MAG: hypothetical protein A3B30_00130 [Candidatus Komeilibacteria bacterium RIFCSPLOWO2_01_FULL_52_15]
MKKKIESILARIRPALNFDGGDIELIKIDAKNRAVFIRFTGMCSHCSISEITLKHLVEREIKRSFPSIATIVAVS